MPIRALAAANLWPRASASVLRGRTLPPAFASFRAAAFTALRCLRSGLRHRPAAESPSRIASGVFRCGARYVAREGGSARPRSRRFGGVCGCRLVVPVGVKCCLKGGRPAPAGSSKGETRLGVSRAVPDTGQGLTCLRPVFGSVGSGPDLGVSQGGQFRVPSGRRFRVR